MVQLVRTFNAGEILFLEGDPGGDIYIIIEGDLRVYLEREGQEIPLAQLSKGEIIGAMTASHQSNRSASVRAITQTSVNVIEGRDFEKLVKDMPFWANVLIKDLVYRLNFMNEMYVLSVTKDNPALQRNEFLCSAIRLAKGILANAKVHQKQFAEGSFINLSLLVAPLLDVYINEKNNFQKIYTLFIESHLLELKDLETPGKFLSKSELHGFQIFFELANQYLEKSAQDQAVDFPVLSERKILFDLALWVKGLSMNAELDVVSVDIGTLEDRLAIAKVKRPNIFALIEKAEDHGMLTIYKSNGRISVYPDKMRQILASMNIIKALDQMQPTGVGAGADVQPLLQDA